MRELGETKITTDFLTNKGVKAFSKNRPTMHPRAILIGESIIEGDGTGKVFRIGQSGNYSEPILFENIEIPSKNSNVNIAIKPEDASIKSNDLNHFIKVAPNKYLYEGKIIPNKIITF